MDERNGKEVKDIREVHKETAHATCYFLQAQRKVKLLMLGKTKSWLNFIVVERLLQVKMILQQSIVDP